MKNLRNITLAVLFVASAITVSSCSDTNSSDFEPTEIKVTLSEEGQNTRDEDDGEFFPGGI